MENAIWVEAREQTTAEAITFWFNFVDSQGWVVFGPSVRIEDFVGGSKVEFRFTRGFSPAYLEENMRFYMLKQRLTEQYGAMVTTKNEP